MPSIRRACRRPSRRPPRNLRGIGRPTEPTCAGPTAEESARGWLKLRETQAPLGASSPAIAVTAGARARSRTDSRRGLNTPAGPTSPSDYEEKIRWPLTLTSLTQAFSVQARQCNFFGAMLVGHAYSARLETLLLWRL